MDEAPGRIPRLALIVGAMKAGTTTLFRGLEGHPQVAACRPKEPEFFLLESQWRKGRDWYEGLFRFDPERHAVALDGSTGPTKPHFVPDGLERLRSYAGTTDLRMLYMVRDPLKRIESHVRHSMARPLYRGGKDGLPDEAVVAVSDYAARIDPLARAFGRDRLRVIALDDLQADPGSVLRETCRFLGLRTDLEWPVPPAQNKGEEWLTFRSGWNPLLRALPARRTRERLMDLVRPGRRQSRLAPLFFKAETPRYELPPEGRQALRERLAPSMERLRREWGVDVSRWGF